MFKFHEHHHIPWNLSLNRPKITMFPFEIPMTSPLKSIVHSCSLHSKPPFKIPPSSPPEKAPRWKVTWRMKRRGSASVIGSAAACRCCWPCSWPKVPLGCRGAVARWWLAEPWENHVKIGVCPVNGGFQWEDHGKPQDISGIYKIYRDGDEMSCADGLNSYKCLQMGIHPPLLQSLHPNQLLWFQSLSTIKTSNVFPINFTYQSLSPIIRFCGTSALNLPFRRPQPPGPEDGAPLANVRMTARDMPGMGLSESDVIFTRWVWLFLTMISNGVWTLLNNIHIYKC